MKTTDTQVARLNTAPLPKAHYTVLPLLVGRLGEEADRVFLRAIELDPMSEIAELAHKARS